MLLPKCVDHLYCSDRLTICPTLCCILIVIYTHPMLQGTGTLTVGVTNINDNTPTFGQSVYSASVAEDQSSGTSVSQLAATDGDVTSSLSYVISAGNAAGKFAFRLGQVIYSPQRQICLETCNICIRIYYC